ncbi:MAG: universal stress protein [Proteobacteria bacterium]|nr:universal stress protein [Pseudomonadota bacterium]
MKNILLLVHDDHGQEARLQAALDITRAVEGHLTCIDVTPYPLIAGDGFGFAETVVILDERESEAKNKSVISERLSREDVSWSWIDAMDEIANAVLDAADLADLIILNRALDGFPMPDMRDIASRIVARASAPVLAVPETLERFELERALVAWDGRPSAAAALRAAVPLLVFAKEVEIFTAEGSDNHIVPEDAAAYLSRHGIAANVRKTDIGKFHADFLISDEAKMFRADYIVMGAYGRGRLRETFGGITKNLLTKSKFPLLMSH